MGEVGPWVGCQVGGRGGRWLKTSGGSGWVVQGVVGGGGDCAGGGEEAAGFEGGGGAVGGVGGSEVMDELPQSSRAGLGCRLREFAGGLRADAG